MKQTFVDRLTKLRTDMWSWGLESWLVSGKRYPFCQLVSIVDSFLVSGGNPFSLSSISAGTLQQTFS